MKKLFLVVGALLFVVAVNADYLITNRKTSIKAEPSSQSDVIFQIGYSSELFLLDDGVQTNGYYHVSSTVFNGEGWIYRTFVRRYLGDLEGSTPGVNVDATGNVDVRILDVGPGLCNLIRLPNNKFVVYDAGHWRGNGNTTLNQIKDFIPENSEIELLILSHTDSDHIGAAGNLLRDYKVKKVLWTGYERSMISSEPPTGTYNRLIDELALHPETENINLHEIDSTITPGTRIQFGNVKLTFLCGFGEPPSTWGLTDHGEKLNSVSIVMKLEYEGRSILFCGDAVGRHRDDPENALIATEKFLVDNAAAHLRSTIVIAPHHGARNGSSKAFVDLTRPETVIFSAGHNFSHPTRMTAERYLQHVDINNIFRTDRGDDEGANEWSHLSVPGCSDDYADDDIHIELRNDGNYKVFYLNANEPCENVI